MKKSLLTIAGASLIASVSFAADVIDTTHDVAWYDTLNTKFCVKVDPSNRVLGLKGLAEVGVKWEAKDDEFADNEVTPEAGKLTIVHKRLKAGANYQGITLFTTEWVGGTSKKFGEGADTLAGMFVDMQEDIVVQATIKSDVACNIRLDIGDVNGHLGNSSTTRVDVVAGAAQNYQFDFTDPKFNPYGTRMFDFYGGDFYGTTNGRYATSQLIYGPNAKDVVKYGAKAFIPVRTDAINRMSFTINDATLGEDLVGTPITVEMTNLVIGNVSNAVNFVPYTVENVDAGKISFNTKNIQVATYGVLLSTPVSEVASASSLVVYPNPAKGQITVNENVTVTTVAGVATGVAGNGVLDISSLVAGTYYVVGTTGTTTLVVE